MLNRGITSPRVLFDGPNGWEQRIDATRIIGNGWASVAGSDGRPRLEDPSDFVRIEVEEALSRDDVRVIPLYVDGASPPRGFELPAPLAALSRRNGLAISHEAFNSDFDRLLKTLERVISTTPD